MGGPISIIFSDIHVSKMEEDIIALMKPHFYKRYVDDTYIYTKKEKRTGYSFWETKFLSLEHKINRWKELYEILRYQNHLYMDR